MTKIFRPQQIIKHVFFSISGNAHAPFAPDAVAAGAGGGNPFKPGRPDSTDFYP
jgi:hypothetical protein